MYWYMSDSTKVPLESFHLKAVANNIIFNDNARCLSIRSGLEWNDRTCSIPDYNVVCEFDVQGLTPTGELI